MAARSGRASASAPASRSARAPASPGRHQPARGGVLRQRRLGEHGLRRGADGGGDHRAAHGRRLDGRAAEGFRLGGGDDGDVRGQEGRRDVLDVADEADVGAEAPAPTCACNSCT